MPADASSRTEADAGPRAARHPRAVIVFLATTIVLLAVDLASKTAAFARVAGAPVVLATGEGAAAGIPPHEPRVIAPRLLALRLTVNEGAVFGLGEGGRWFFVAFSVVASAIVLGVFARSRPRALVLHLALACVLAGAIGNLYDRLRFGVVRDMLLLFPDVRLPFGWHWPDGSDGLYPWIFNVADVCLVVGLLLLLVLTYRGEGTKDPR